MPRESSRTPFSDRGRGARHALVASTLLLFSVASTLPSSASLAAEADASPDACISALVYAGVLLDAEGLNLSDPRGLAEDHRGNLIIVDTGNHRALIVTPDGLLKNELGGYGWDESQFDTPTDVSVTQGLYIYVLDHGNRRVQRFQIDGDYLDTIVAEDEAGTPVAMDVATSGEVFLLDEDSQLVWVYSQFGEAMEPIGQFGTGEGGLVAPVDVCFGPTRKLAVADAGRRVVEIFDEFGDHLNAVSLGDSLSPTEVVFDSAGNLLVACEEAGRILAFAASGGRPTASIDFGEILPGITPTGMLVGRDGRLLVLDGEGDRVLIVEVAYGKCEETGR